MALSKDEMAEVDMPMPVANHAQCGGINEVNVAAHQLGKRRFRAALGVISQ